MATQQTRPFAEPGPSAPPPRAIGGRYVLERPIGLGGMARVYLAHDQREGCPVALKLLSPHWAADPAFVQRFQREAQLAARLHHPNIVAIRAWGAVADTRYIALEYVPGRDLRRVLDERGPLPSAEAAAIAAQVAAALDAAHQQGIVHRDIKPHNILLDEQGRVKVTDFGIAQALGATRLTQSAVVLGSAHYLSPEQAQGQPVDGRADLYSLGVVLYELLTGRVPFDGESAVAVAVQHIQTPPPSPRQFQPSLSHEIEAIVLKALAKAPEQRYQSAAEMRRALEPAVHPTPARLEPPVPASPAAGAAPAPVGPPAGPPPSQPRWWGWGLAALMTLLFGLGLAVAALPRAAPSPGASTPVPGSPASPPANNAGAPSQPASGASAPSQPTPSDTNPGVAPVASPSSTPTATSSPPPSPTATATSSPTPTMEARNNPLPAPTVQEKPAPPKPEGPKAKPTKEKEKKAKPGRGGNGEDDGDAD